MTAVDTFLEVSRVFPPNTGLASHQIVLRFINGEYVTHFYNVEDGGYHHGHYFSSETVARADYHSRVSRSYKDMSNGT